MTLEQRLAELYSGLEDVCREFHPDVFAVEEIYSNYKYPKTAVIMGHARGVLFLAAGTAGIPVFSYSATRIKKSLTGSGHASKEQISRMVSATLNCGEINMSSDVTDAVAAALCHINAVSHGGFF
jgi:crossover junction endodeoxyribonuclease RuvC